MSTSYQNASIDSNNLKKSNANRIIVVLSTTLILTLLALGYVIVNQTKQFTDSDYECSRTCCDSVKFNAIREGYLDTLICNYRNNEWWKSSGLFRNDDFFNYDIWQQRMNEANERVGLPATTMYDTSYNARYMDINLESLDNYICTIKRNCGIDAQYIRFYYIRYGNNSHNQAFANKHSLALIPVRRDLREIPNAKDCSSSADAKSLIFISNIANHNEICPPEPPLGCSDRLNKLDHDSSTYN